MEIGSAIEVTPTDLYYIGRAFVPTIDMNKEEPPWLALMMPIKDGVDDITKAYRLLMYQYGNYWGLYSLGLINKIPLEVNVRECIYDRISTRGYSSRDGANSMVENLSMQQFHIPGTVKKAILKWNNPKRNTFASHISKDMTEKAIKRAWFAARIMSEVSRPSELSLKVDARIAEIYLKCKEAAKENGVTLQSFRNSQRS